MAFKNKKEEEDGKNERLYCVAMWLFVVVVFYMGFVFIYDEH